MDLAAGRWTTIGRVERTECRPPFNLEKASALNTDRAAAQPPTKLDNSQNKQEFNFVYLGKNEKIPAGATRTITSLYPIVIGYDRGNGMDYAIKSVSFSGNVQIGVNAADNLWDLFPTTDNQREKAKLKLFA